MAAFKNKESTNENTRYFSQRYFLLAASSVIALIITFTTSIFNLTIEIKAWIFLLVIVFYLLVCALLFRYQKKQTGKFLQNVAENADLSLTSEDAAKLRALEEANEFFSTTLNSADMFRLVASRIGEMLPFEICLLAIADETKTKLKFSYVAGAKAQDFHNLEILSHKGMAGQTFQTAAPQIENLLNADRNVISEKILSGLNSSIAVPLSRADECFGALVLYAAKEKQFDARSLLLLEAIAERVAPLFTSTQAFENSLTSALTDALTKLPNERGFYLVLENQIAEAQRYRNQRLLAVLTIDIRNFGELNQKYGHATADKILEYAAATIKNQLRQMDFLARSTGDEFIAVLPTASEEITGEIIERVKKSFVSKPFEVTPQEKVHLQLNFGSSAFGKDGETAGQLLKNAVLRKQQSKSAESGKILWFPKEYVN